MRKMLVSVVAVMGLSACAAPEGVQQAAIQNCLQVGIAQNDPQFPVCARSYALQQTGWGVEPDLQNRGRRAPSKIVIATYRFPQ